ncbi:beta-ketoacyl-ACP synthase II [Cohnella candidum]|uniref:3-oxoacyl-[acyl-carrier-protein] synthase 2 n=1 Tax=Cohnella candidum TaxID=2674991 RepID=A0A3G3JVS0_9BACL|nr:beta-ketoacyl-ACP synthase II [Cohnella candidum]AYQ72338.1 beta-ketoacyl-[acyl-carrier-protein] synthase II [Cohnella candidum]
MRNRVVITGMGCVTPLGLDKETSWRSAASGICGIRRLAPERAEQLPVRLAAEIPDFDPHVYMDAKEARRTDRFIQLAIAAAEEAIRDSGLAIGRNADPERTGVWIGSGAGGIRTFEKGMLEVLQRGYRRMSPFALPMFLPNMAASRVAIRHGIRGPANCSVTACASGTNSIGEAFRAIQRGEADVMLAGGAEAPICSIGLASFAAMGALSASDDPAEGCRPFDKGRNGFVMGEGAGVLVLESLLHARERGADIYAELLGFGSCGDGFHVAAPRPDGSDWSRAMSLALEDAGLAPKDIAYINAHGTGTPQGDLVETRAIKQAFGVWAYDVSVSSTKSASGHLLGASGAVEAIFSVLALRDQIIPPTIHFREYDDELDLHYTPNLPRRKTIRAAMSNTFAFGGHNAVLVFGSL